MIVPNGYGHVRGGEVGVIPIGGAGAVAPCRHRRYERSRQGAMSYFRLEERGSSVRTEVLAGLHHLPDDVRYIIFVNPLVLGETGMDTGAVLVATCLAAAFGSAVMGLLRQLPHRAGPGDGTERLLRRRRGGHAGASLQTALGAVFCSGVLMLVLSVLPVREWVVNAIPRSQKLAIAAGIGFFLVIIGLRNAESWWGAKPPWSHWADLDALAGGARRRGIHWASPCWNTEKSPAP